ncbi:hypothetical protein THC_0707 [Caldimicrobium thiodismutans]|uniref:Uncharacterized protein n=1 Tax=Caldimicrobium thiodismutans TaxID=1653476 RepID=A0A0U4W1X1_9BACT|nr:hypothetical protein [Caldimicrobium thiodismutans]BAU23099.1 hypothetical protein THC_0707 [Caldimicrobium thiodismutans]
MKGQLKHFLIALISILILFSYSFAKEDIIFLYGGNAWNLFESYIKKAEKEGKKLKLGDLKVKVWNGKEFAEYSIKWQDYLKGDPVLKLWENKLKNVEAKYDPKAVETAKKYGWVVYGIGSVQADSSASENISKPQAKGSCSPDAESFINLGIQSVNNKKYDNALKEFKKALEISPTCPEAYGNLVSLYVIKKNYNLAIDTYKEGINKAGDNGFLHITGAIAYTKRRDFDYALIALEKALTSGFKDKSVLDGKDLEPLFSAKKKEFCGILERAGIVLKKCL